MASPALHSLSLGAGLLLAARQLRLNSADSLSYNRHVVGKSKGLLLIFTLTTLGLLRLARSEASALRRDRRVQRKDSSAPKPVAAKKAKAESDFWPEFGRLIRLGLFPTGSVRCRGGALLAVQTCGLVLRTLLTVKATRVNTLLLTRAIAKGSWTVWGRWMYNFVAWACGATLCNTGLHYVERLIALELRNGLTRAAHARYLAANSFHRVLHGLEGADQRICADIAAFSGETARLFGHSGKPVLEFSLSLASAATELGYARPLALFASQVVLIGALRGLAPKLGKMVAREAELEGNLRSAHARLIAHAEEIAFLKGGDTERGLLNTRLTTLISAQRLHSLQRIRRSVTENISKFQGLLVGGTFVHVPFLARSAETEGNRISSFRATEEVMLRCGAAFSEILLLGRSVDELAGHTQRISSLFRALEAPPAASPVTDGDMVSFYNVTISAPEPNGQHRVLVRNLTLDAPPGSSCIVTGPNGAGKTSIFRVLAGLWAPTSGTMQCPRGGILYLPQSPYLVQGNLRDQVTYPSLMGFQRRHDPRILECLRLAGLDKLADSGLDAEHPDWEDVLSGGERQRVGWARLFFAAPAYAVLDEATAAINPEGALQLYTLLSTTTTTFFSVAHRMELRAFHKRELIIKGDGEGSWELLKLS